MSHFPAPVIPPPLSVPPSNNSVKISIIDTGVNIQGLPTSLFFEPSIKGYDTLDCSVFSFLIEHEHSGTRVLFDLGISTSWNAGPPLVVNMLQQLGVQVSAPKNVSEMLIENDVPLDSINSIIWSHWHWDHTGDPSLFPPSTSLTVGPGFKSALLPGYPTNPNSPILERAYKDRELVEISFEHSQLTIGRFRAFDYFGDGSFYLLDSPGHTIGHMCGLARTTKDTFVLLGADACHHAAQMRPTPYLPLPEHISPNPFSFRSKMPICPGSLLLGVHSNHSAIEPFVRVSNPPGGGASSDPVEAQNTIDKLGEVDGHENILTVIAHDKTMLEVLDFFPQSLNDWKAKGYKERSMWNFLKDFEAEVSENEAIAAPRTEL